MVLGFIFLLYGVRKYLTLPVAIPYLKYWIVPTITIIVPSTDIIITNQFDITNGYSSSIFAVLCSHVQTEPFLIPVFLSTFIQFFIWKSGEVKHLHQWKIIQFFRLFFKMKKFYTKVPRIPFTSQFIIEGKKNEYEVALQELGK